jgi:MSHA biogenesis protein MshL
MTRVVHSYHLPPAWFSDRLPAAGLRPTLLACAVLLASCAAPPAQRNAEMGATLRAEVAAATAASAAAQTPPALAAAPVPPPAPPEPRFDLIVSNANARDVFQSMVTDTPYSMLMHPDVRGTMSVTLRAVTVREALESIRDVYGYDFRIEGRRITVYPPTMQTRIFTVNYLTSQRRGRSDTRVTGGVDSVSGTGNGTNGANGANGSNTNNGNNGSPPPAGTIVATENSRVLTTSNSDFWTETADALRALLGAGEGRIVVTSPQAGTIAVRAMPDELRQVAQFLHDSQIAVDRQVMLEAKIVEVDLRHGYESGVDWSLLKSHAAIGQTSGSVTNPLLANANGLPTLPTLAANLIEDSVLLPQAAGGTAGLTLASRGFQAVLGFLETNGDVQILSSPRVATLNNQKAVLKVGTDAFYVTGITGGSITPGNSLNNGTTTLPTLTLTPFFSGIALDVTPQIDEGNMITLHLRPSVTTVTQVTTEIDLGSIGAYKLPLASSNVNETDTVVRVPDGQIVAIGGLMQSDSTNSQSGLPGSDNNAVTRNLLGNTSGTSHKKELVVLIKPTIIRNNDDWQRDTSLALAGFGGPAVRTVVVVPTAAAAATSVATPATSPAASSPATPIAAPAPAATASAAAVARAGTGAPAGMRR